VAGGVDRAGDPEPERERDPGELQARELARRRRGQRHGRAAAEEDEDERADQLGGRPLTDAWPSRLDRFDGAHAGLPWTRKPNLPPRA
jgi:hypothetical protein